VQGCKKELLGQGWESVRKSHWAMNERKNISIQKRNLELFFVYKNVPPMECMECIFKKKKKKKVPRFTRPEVEKKSLFPPGVFVFSVPFFARLSVYLFS
jgi:hypothetical protein